MCVWESEQSWVLSVKVGVCWMVASIHKDERGSEWCVSRKRAGSGREVSGEGKGSKCGQR